MGEPHTPKINFKKLGSVSFNRLRRRMMHPTQMPFYLGFLWGVLATLVVPPIVDKFHLGVEYFQIIFVPPFLLAGFCGYSMFRRNIYFAGRHDICGNDSGRLVYGFPAKLYGVIYMIFSWGFALVWAVLFIYRW